MERPPRVCLAISSFRNDASVQRLLDAAATPRARARFDATVVVDSLGTGSMAPFLELPAHSHVVYENATVNLGSAGNFARRLTLAAELGCDFVFALNHDGELDLDLVDRLVEFATSRPNVGAAYPLRFLSKRGAYELTGRSRWAVPTAIETGRPQGPERVTWSSSNGSLYSLVPVREGLVPWADLWMGWEDLGYGWLLDRAGYAQYVVDDAHFADNYEYATHRFLGREVHITDKPSWYAYYQIRNLILITRRLERPLWDQVIVGGRLVQEIALTTLFRAQKRQRLRLLLRGAADGIRNRAGRGPVPNATKGS